MLKFGGSNPPPSIVIKGLSMTHETKQIPTWSLAEKHTLLENYVITKSRCWEWIRSTRQGYGAIKVSRQIVQTHRFSYRIHKGVIPKGQLVCHTCDNRLCINPDHLFLGTHSDNMKDAFKKGRLTTITSKGSESYNTHLTEEDVLEIRSLEGLMPVIDIARKYKVARTTIRHIHQRNTWRHI